MATRHMILQSILFLNNTKQELLFMYNDKTYIYIYINLHKLPKIDLKNPKNAIFEFFISVVYSLLPWQQHKQLIQLIAWLKMFKLCLMFVLYVFILYAGRQLYVIFD